MIKVLKEHPLLSLIVPSPVLQRACFAFQNLLFPNIAHVFKQTAKSTKRLPYDCPRIRRKQRLVTPVDNQLRMVGFYNLLWSYNCILTVNPVFPFKFFCTIQQTLFSVAGSA